MCVYVYIYKMKVIQSHIVILQHLKYLLSFLLSSYLTGHLLLKVCTLPLPWSFPRRYMVHAYMFFRWLVKWHCFWETLLDHPSKIACSHYPCSLHSLPPSTIHKHHQGPGVPAPRLMPDTQHAETTEWRDDHISGARFNFVIKRTHRHYPYFDLWDFKNYWMLKRDQDEPF